MEHQGGDCGTLLLETGHQAEEKLLNHRRALSSSWSLARFLLGWLLGRSPSLNRSQEEVSFGKFKACLPPCVTSLSEGEVLACKVISSPRAVVRFHSILSIPVSRLSSNLKSTQFV